MRRADRINGKPEGRRREEGRGQQGGPRDHRPGPEGSQGPDRSRWRGQGRRFEGRSCQVPEGPGSGRCHGRSEVSGPCVASGKGDKPRLGAKDPGLWPLLQYRKTETRRKSAVYGEGVLVPEIPTTSNRRASPGPA